MNDGDQVLERALPLFDAVLDLAPAEQAAFLDQACGGDVALRVAVAHLLAAEGAPAPLLDAPALALAAGLLEGTAPGPTAAGRFIGPYRIERELGRGGMGVVYLAERTDVAKRVALKLMRDPMAAPERVGRFLLERGVLARLDHPYIARLLDAGVTPDAGTQAGGTPWFAMELVEGEPIDRACDTRRLTIAERLAHFAQACEAVQYAHEHLVVHCDLKPSNILLGPSGVKLLDFGIAKLLGDAGGEDGGLTETGARPLTPDYAGPEQLRGEPVTTATDVYALGVVLYELLTGQRPHARRRTPSGDVEQTTSRPEPARPSAVVARPESAAARTAVSTARRASPERLARQLRGDLDTIVLKALAAEPARRYPSAQQLLDDVRNYRAGRPVTARPDTWRYRARKFTARNRAGVGALAALMLLLAGVAGVMTYQRAEVVRERDRARQEAAKARRGATFFGELLMAASPGGVGQNATARDLLDLGAKRSETLADEPELQAWMFTALGFAYFNRGEYARAYPALDTALAIKRRLHPGGGVDVGQSLLALGRLLSEQGDLPSAERLLREQIAMDRRLLGDGRSDLVKGLTSLGDVLRTRGDMPGAERAYREAIARAAALPEPIIYWGYALGGLGAVLEAKGRMAEAETALGEGLAMVRAVGGPDHAEQFAQLGTLAAVRLGAGRLDDAAALARQAVDGARRTLGPTHPKVASTLHALALVQQARGDARGAEAAYREALASQRGALPAGSARTAATLGALGRLLAARGRAAEAEPLLREALDADRRMLVPGAPEIAAVERALGACCAAPAGPPSEERTGALHERPAPRRRAP